MDKLKPILQNTKTYGTVFIKWLLLGLLTGLLCGALGTLFSQSVALVTELRGTYHWLLYLLPVAGLLSVGIYRLLKVTAVGTNHVLVSARSNQKLPVLLAPAVFAGSVLTHLCGGSAGREGAALQLGGSVTVLIAKVLRLQDNDRQVLTVCGMAALFSAVFGTPLGACVFALEVVCVGSVRLTAVFPTLVAGISAYMTASSLGAHGESFPLASVPNLALQPLWKVVLIAVAGALVSILFVGSLRLTEKWFKKWFKNDFLRIAVGGALIVLLTLILGTTDYNGGGIPVIERIFTSGAVRYEAFLLKILFTAVTVAAGYKGGEIIPTFFIGGTLGGTLGILLGLNPAFGAAVGMVALFCGVTNCPLATIILAIELLGAQGMVYFALAAGISFLLSGNTGLYSGQQFAFSRVKE